MENFYKGKQILITGGAGHIGQLLTDKLLEFEPEVIRILDIHENGLFPGPGHPEPESGCIGVWPVVVIAWIKMDTENVLKRSDVA